MFTPSSLGVALLMMMMMMMIKRGLLGEHYKGVEGYCLKIFYWNCAVGISLISVASTCAMEVAVTILPSF